MICLAWQTALFAGKVVSPASFARMITPFKGNYGFGLVIMDPGGHHQIWHNGGIDGFNTYMANYPNDHLTVIVLDNIGSGAGVIANKLADISFGKTVILTSERKEVPVDGKVLARYVGHYQLSPDFALDITQAGNSLYLQATRQEKLPLFAESPTDFFLTAADAQISFVADGDGPARALVLHQNGQDITGTRVP